MPDLPDILTTVVLGPDDRLVIVVPLIDEAHEESIRQAVDHVGLHGRVLVVDEGAQLAVLRGKPTAEGSMVGPCGDWQESAFLGQPGFICHLGHGHTGDHSDGTTTWGRR